MAELVEQRRGVVEADEGRHALRALGEIIIVRREDIACPPERLLAAIGGHPRARALSVAREIIEIKEPDIRVGLEVIDLESPHLGIEDRDGTGIFPETKVVEMARRPEHSVDPLGEMDRGLQYGRATGTEKG